MQDITKIEHVLKTLLYVQKVKDTERKTHYLLTHESEELKKILWYAYNPLFTFGIDLQELDNYSGTVSQEDEFKTIWELFDLLIKRSVIGSAALGIILSLKEVQSEEVYQLVKLVLSKDLQLGLSASDINDMFEYRRHDKWYIPEKYDEKLALKYKDKHKKNKYKTAC
jgi:hypothetical protein